MLAEIPQTAIGSCLALRSRVEDSTKVGPISLMVLEHKTDSSLTIRESRIAVRQRTCELIGVPCKRYVRICLTPQNIATNTSRMQLSLSSKRRLLDSLVRLPETATAVSLGSWSLSSITLSGKVIFLSQSSIKKLLITDNANNHRIPETSTSCIGVSWR